MIDREYCVTMARYNSWQNNQLMGLLDAMDPVELTRDRGAFYGSVLRTVNHLLWADQLWMSRIQGTDGPVVDLADSVDLHPTLGSWNAERFRTDGRMTLWAEKLNNIALKGDLSFYSAVMGRDVTRPVGLCVTHMFNHQTHHRGQVHAMLSQAGSDTPISDLFFMPEDA
jgi:uncharacterized damage-inducible protein DinB